MTRSVVLDVIAKAVQADPEAAAVLMDEIAREVIHDQIELYADAVEPVYKAFLANRLAIARQTIGKAYIAKTVNGVYPDDSYQQSAEWLSSIEALVIKADWNYDAEQKHHRDVRGRFMTWVKSSPATPTGKSPHQLSPANRLADYATADEADKKKLAAEQGEWTAANNLMEDFKRTFPGGTRDVEATFTYKNGNGDPGSFTVPLSQGKIDPQQVGQYDLESTLQTVDITAGANASEDVKRRVDAFNTIGRVTGSTSAAGALAGMSPDALRAFGDELNQDATNPDRTRLQGFFGRLKAGGDVLEGTPGQKYGRMATLAGTFGSEADKALGPAAQRAAYRYRGTEKTPDQDLRRVFASRELAGLDSVAESRNVEHRAAFGQAAANSIGQNGTLSPLAGAASHRISESALREDPMIEDELKMKVRADVAASHLIRTLPDDPMVAELSRKSGSVLPSQGVLIDADGDVVAQSVGYAEDHYLPFNLGNLQRLKGGQYVRTRVQGGMTGEDVYTLAASGARMGTVVSSSGIFTLEMDPNYRGGHAGPERARMVYDRYLKILDAVEGSGLYTKDLPRKERSEVDTMARSAGIPTKMSDERYKRLVEAKRRDLMTLSSDQMSDIEAATADEIDKDKRYDGLDTKRKAALYDDLLAERVEEAKEELVQPLALNADGYKLALQTLQQQFPYFIRTASYEPLKSVKDGVGFFESRRLDDRQAHRQRARSTDQGYVRPGQLKSEGTSDGFYATSNRSGREGRGRLKTKTLGPGAGRDEGAEPAAAEATGGAKPEAKESGAPSPAPDSKSVAPTGALAQMIARNAKEYEDKRDQAVGDLHQLWSQLQSTTTVEGAAGTSMGLKGLKGAAAGSNPQVRDQQVAQYLLGLDQGEFSAAFDEDPTVVLTALNNRPAVLQAANKAIHQATHSEDEPVASFGIKDVNTMAEFANHVADTAQRVADYSALATGKIFTHRGEDPFSTAGPPLLPGLDAVANMEQLDAFAATQGNEQAVALAKQIGIDPTSKKPRTFAETDKAFGMRIEALGKVNSFSQHLSEGISDPNAVLGQGDKVAERAMATALRGVDMDTLETVAPPGVMESPEAMQKWAADPVNGPAATAQALQTAWAIVTTARFVDVAEGGDVVPKDRPALDRLVQVLVPAAKADSSRPVVRQEVQKRLALVLPPLPKTWNPQTGSSRR